MSRLIRLQSWIPLIRHKIRRNILYQKLDKTIKIYKNILKAKMAATYPRWLKERLWRIVAVLPCGSPRAKEALGKRSWQKRCRAGALLTELHQRLPTPTSYAAAAPSSSSLPLVHFLDVCPNATLAQRKKKDSYECNAEWDFFSDTRQAIFRSAATDFLIQWSRYELLHSCISAESISQKMTLRLWLIHRANAKYEFFALNDLIPRRLRPTFQIIFCVISKTHVIF